MEKNYKYYIENSLKSEKGIVKKRLLKWGGALNMCDMRQEEINRIKRTCENTVKIYSQNFMDIEHTTVRNFEKIKNEFEKEIERLYLDIENIIKEKRIMDEYIKELIPIEQEFLYLKYRKGYDFNFVAMKMNVSRSQVFRIKAAAIDNLIEIIKNHENEIF